jgi:hypothetical protein
LQEFVITAFVEEAVCPFEGLFPGEQAGSDEKIGLSGGHVVLFN